MNQVNTKCSFYCSGVKGGRSVWTPKFVKGISQEQGDFEIDTIGVSTDGHQYFLKIFTFVAI